MMLDEIELETYLGQDEALPDAEQRARSPRVYAASIAAMAEVMAAAAGGRPPSPRIVRRLAHDLTDAAERDPACLIALLSLPVERSRLGAHLVRVAVLSILCAEKLGLSKQTRAETALAALCHHLACPDEAGYVAPVEGDNDPIEAALALGGDLDGDRIRRVVAIYEALSAGEPYLEAPGDDPMGRVIALADRCAELLESLPVDRALLALLGERWEEDQLLACALVDAVSLYPVGTLVELDSGVKAVVVEAPSGLGQYQKPVVRPIDGDNPELDLSLCDDKIARTLDPVREGVNVVRLLLA